MSRNISYSLMDSARNDESMTNLLFPLLLNLLNLVHTAQDLNHISLELFGGYYNSIYYYLVKAKARWWNRKNVLGKCLEEM